jgi:hypothetical protein
MTIGKDVYERYAIKERTGAMRRSHITRRRKPRGLRGRLSLLGLGSASLCPNTEQTCEVRLVPDGYLHDDTDNVLAALLLLCGRREWRNIQSELTKEQLECCLSVSRLKMNQKWDEPSDSLEEEVLA